MRVLVFGDSIAQGFWDTEGGWVDRLKRHYDQISLQDLHARSFTTVFNLGVSGDRITNLLKRVKFETQVRKWPNEPQIVVLAIGTNDDALEQSVTTAGTSRFKNDLAEIIKELKPLVSKVVLVGNPACDESRTRPVFWTNLSYTNLQLQKTEKIVEIAAREFDLPFVPIFAEFQQKLDAGQDLLEDGLHPNNAGHQLIFDLVRPELDKLIS